MSGKTLSEVTASIGQPLVVRTIGVQFNTCNMKFTLVTQVGNKRIHASISHEQADMIKDQVMVARGHDAWKARMGTCDTYGNGKTKNTHIVYFDIDNEKMED